MYPERIERARKAAGLSLRALAEQVGVSHTAIKKIETGQLTPDSSQIIKFAKALEVRSEYFFRPFELNFDGEIEYRKRANTSKKLLRRIHADVLEQAERWHELENLYAVFPIRPFKLPSDLPSKVDSMYDVELVADKLRKTWKLGTNPVPELVDVLEQRGVLVIATNVEIENKFDGLMANINGKPIVVLSKSWSGDRQRFTLAHELGHLLLHGRLASGLDEEKACNRFAGSFLLPKSAVIMHLGEQRRRIEWQELYLLKHEFGLSMAACLYRALDVGLITSAWVTSTQKLFSKKGWRRQEPGDVYPSEHSFLFKQLVYRALSEEWIGESKAAELLQMPLACFCKDRKLENIDAATN